MLCPHTAPPDTPVLASNTCCVSQPYNSLVVVITNPISTYIGPYSNETQSVGLFSTFPWPISEHMVWAVTRTPHMADTLAHYPALWFWSFLSLSYKPMARDNDTVTCLWISWYFTLTLWSLCSSFSHSIMITHASVYVLGRQDLNSWKLII